MPGPRVDAITVQNYRAFAGPQRLTLRPLTLLYGGNNAGKSSLARLLPLVADSTSEDQAGALNLSSPATRGASFADLLWRGRGSSDDRRLHLTLHIAERQVHYAFDLYEDPVHNTPPQVIIRAFDIADASGAKLVRLRWTPPLSSPQPFEQRHPVGPPIALSFRGLIPEGPGLAPEIARIGDALRGLSSRYQWLPAGRKLPRERAHNLPAAPRTRLRSDQDRDVIEALLDPEICGEVSGWYERTVDRTLALEALAGSSVARLVLRHAGGGFAVDLQDNGEGMARVLPVLTALALARRADATAPLLIVEEPESELHPSLQRKLAQEFAAAAAQPNPPTLVVETHSPFFLLGVQHAILSGDLSPEQVILYWVSQGPDGRSVAAPVTFDAEARPVGDWPADVFTEDLEMAREIMELRQARAGGA